MRARAWDCAVYRKRCRAVNTNKAADRKFLQLSEKMVRWCGFLLVLGASLQAAGCMGTKQLELSVGQVFILNCSNFYGDEVISVNWTRESNQDWDAGIKVINQSLWFFPVQESHSGKYSCYFSDKDGPFEMNFSISVSKSKCPQVASSVVLMTNRLGHLNCGIKGLREIGKLNPSNMGWTWMKDCSPLSWHEQSDKLRFTRVSNGDKGVYTCFLNFSHNGTSYIMAQSMQVMITDPGPVPQKPRVIKPRQETLEVKLGSTQVLNCKVFVGSGSCTMEHVETISPYWLVNGMFVEHYRNHFNTHNGCTTEDNVEYRHSTLTIFEARQEFFNIPFQCVVHSSLGYDNGTVILIQYRHRELYCTLAVFTAFAVVALGFLLFYQFKVDLVLAYRNLSPCLKPQNDGKLYDAYVSYLHGDDHSVPFATTFALHVLPEVLEDRLGYKLFISGRDALPGAAVHDVISETVGKSRRLIIVLPSQPFTKSSDSEMKGRLLNKMPPQHLSLNNNITATDPDLSESSRLNWGPYECLVGLYDALVKESLKVILVQVGGEVDDALLPESLRYVRHTQGILKWKQHYTSEPNGRFWKQMRYRMPPVQKTRTAVMV